MRAKMSCYEHFLVIFRKRTVATLFPFPALHRRLCFIGGYNVIECCGVCPYVQMLPILRGSQPNLLGAHGLLLENCLIHSRCCFDRAATAGARTRVKQIQTFVAQI